MRNILSLILLLILSVFIGYGLHKIISPFFVKTVEGANILEIELSFINSPGEISIKSYNESYELVINARKSIDIENDEKGLPVPNWYKTTIPIQDSHKIELELISDKKDGVIFINGVRVNSRIIPVNSFLNNSKSNDHYQIGTMTHVDGVFLKSNNDRILLDITNSLNLPKVTKSELITFSEEYKELNYLCCSFFIVFIFLVNYISFIRIQKCDVTNSKRIILRFIAINALIASFFLIYVAYLGHFKMALEILNPDKGKLFNHFIFFQNFIPLISFVYAFIIASYLLKNKLIKLILIIIPLIICATLLVDNCILDVVGTRLNFRMGGNFTGRYEYFYEFIVKYVTSESGVVMLFGIVIIVSFCFATFLIKGSITKSNIYSLVLLLFVSLFGLYPQSLLGSDYKLANPFQINGWCVQKIGNFFKEYSNDYQNRSNLNLRWETHEGLNQKKNVIILLVESWGCSFTYACGIGPSYMPNIESLVSDSVFFDNYYSVMPSTSLSYLSIVKGVPAIQFAWDEDNTADDNSYVGQLLKTSNDLYSQNDLINNFKTHGYKTRFISSTDLVFQMDVALKFSAYDEIIDANNPVFNNIKDRGVFNGVNDEDMFKVILDKISSEEHNFLYITKTASNHSPYNSPLGFQNMELAFKYTDQAVFNFISSLKKIGYFDNGILVMLGDHYAWGIDNIDPAHVNEPTYVNRVPLVIIDGKNHGVVNHSEFSHASLGVLLQYLQLPKYKKHKFNINPLKDDASETIFGYDFGKMNFIFVKSDNRQATVVLNGDDSYFIQNDVFTDEESREILGYIASFRR